MVISTDGGLTDVIECINGNLELFLKYAVVSIDLKKEFDTIDHDILYKKLGNYGIRCSALHLFKSYLSNRSQCVEYDNFIGFY